MRPIDLRVCAIWLAGLQQLDPRWQFHMDSRFSYFRDRNMQTPLYDDTVLFTLFLPRQRLRVVVTLKLWALLEKPKATGEIIFLREEISTKNYPDWQPVFRHAIPEAPLKMIPEEYVTDALVAAHQAFQTANSIVLPEAK